MRRVFVGLTLVIGMWAVSGSVSPALADVAPPQYPPGASVKNGQADTKVQMVSEDVLMTIDAYESTGADQNKFRKPFMLGHVDATFMMKNQGDAAEAFDVWFPLGVPNGFGDVATLDNFKAWVDGVEATNIGQTETVGQWDTMVPWATWPASFPPGQEVTLRVTYDTIPTGYNPYAEFGYVLETGAGWFGTIGEGTVTFRFPYEVNELNADLNTNKNDSYAARGGPFSVSGTDVVWHFTDLEPNEGSNIALTALSPSVWQAIQAAEAAAQADPNSAQAQLALAEAYHSGLAFKYGLIDIGGSQTLLDKSKQAFEAALKLDPQNADIYVSYLELLRRLQGPIELPSPYYVSLLDQALKVAPDNEKLLEMQHGMYLQLTYGAEQGTFVPATSIPAETSAPLPEVTATPAAVVATATPVLVPPGTPTPLPAPGGGVLPSAITLILVVAVAGGCVIVLALGAGFLLGRRAKRD